MMVMDSLLSQEIGFFDKTKSGNLTSRLTSDTSVVGELNYIIFILLLFKTNTFQQIYSGLLHTFF